MGWSLAHQTQMQRQIKDKTIHLHSGQYWDFQANMSFPHLNGHRSLRAAWDLHFSHFCLLLMISDFLHRSQRHFLLLNLFDWYEYFRFKRILIKHYLKLKITFVNFLSYWYHQEGPSSKKILVLFVFIFSFPLLRSENDSLAVLKRKQYHRKPGFARNPAILKHIIITTIYFGLSDILACIIIVVIKIIIKIIIIIE